MVQRFWIAIIILIIVIVSSDNFDHFFILLLILDREEEAKAQNKEGLNLHKTFSLNKYIDSLAAKDPESLRQYVEALRKTGVPE